MNGRHATVHAGGLPRLLLIVLWTLGVGYRTPVVAAADGAWPTYRHDNRRSGVTDERLTLPLERTWCYTSPALPQPAWTGPAKWDAFSGNSGLQSLRNFETGIRTTEHNVANVGTEGFSRQIVDFASNTPQLQNPFFIGAPASCCPIL